MKICVLIKQIPNTEAALRINSERNWIEEDSLTFEMNESDAYALEEALLMSEAYPNEAEVVVISMGPDRVQKVIREALAKGADRGIHIQEQAPYETDPFTIARLFQAAIKDEAPDLVFSGLQSEDLGSGQTGILLGELMGMSTASLVMETDVTESGLRVKRELESGWFQWVQLSLPASITIQSGINQPRYPSLRGIMGAKKKEIKTLLISDLLPERSPLQTVGNVFIQKKEKQTRMLEGDLDSIVNELVLILKTEVKVL